MPEDPQPPPSPEPVQPVRWPARREGFLAWVAEESFDDEGRRRRPLMVRPT